MNKLLKLPIFLGACGALCAGILAGVNALTSKPIVDYEKAKKEEAYKSIFSAAGYNAEGKINSLEINEINDDLYNNGCTGIAVVTDATIKGAVYDFECAGFGGTFKFQIGFANGKYIGYTDISSSETNVGATLISNLAKPGNTSLIYGQDVATEAVKDGKYLFVDNTTGSTVTGGKIAIACKYASADYQERFK